VIAGKGIANISAIRVAVLLKAKMRTSRNFAAAQLR